MPQRVFPKWLWGVSGESTDAANRRFPSVELQGACACGCGYLGKGGEEVGKDLWIGGNLFLHSLSSALPQLLFYSGRCGKFRSEFLEVELPLAGASLLPLFSFLSTPPSAPPCPRLPTSFLPSLPPGAFTDLASFLNTTRLWSK